MSDAGPGNPNSPLAAAYDTFFAAPGSVVAQRYCLLSKLGHGGMGTVWRAEDRALCIEVALKLIDPSLVDSTVALARFQQEAHAAARLRSTHIVHINDYGIDEATGQPFIAMDLLEGESLQQRLDRLGKISFTETQSVMAQVARALELAHSKGIAHRDLKPENIFLAREGDSEVVKVLDFGIAKQLNVLTVSGELKTREGQMLGTPNYMSPEQTRARGDIDHRTDVWAFGVIVFECVTGARPFDSDNLASLVLAICTGPIPDPASFTASPVGFTQWFARTVERDVERRFATISLAASELSRLVDVVRPNSSSGVPTLAAFDTPTGVVATHGARPKNPLFARFSKSTRRLSLAVLVGIALLTGAIWIWRKAPSSKPTAPTPAIVLPASALAVMPMPTASAEAHEPTTNAERNPATPGSDVVADATAAPIQQPTEKNRKQSEPSKPASAAKRRSPTPPKAVPLDPGI